MRFMKKLSCVFLVFMALCGAAAANVAYTTVDASYTSAIGVIDEGLQVRRTVGNPGGAAVDVADLPELASL